MYSIIVDGEPWQDSDGDTEWKFCIAVTLEELIFKLGYTDVQFIKVS